MLMRFAKRSLQESHPPLRQLLYVEWVLLGMGALMLLTVTLLSLTQGFPWQELFTLTLFGLMGLRLPTRHRSQLLYTAFELSLLVFIMISSANLAVMMRLVSLLGLVIVIRSCQLFQPWGRLVIVGLVYSLHLFAGLVYGDTAIRQEMLKPITQASPADWQINVFKTNAMILFALVLVFVSLLVNALLVAYRSQQNLAIAHQQLQQYALRVESQATLQERNRIAREIHDSLGHALTAQTILLENALLYLPSDRTQAKTYLVAAKQSAYQALQEVSASVSVLRANPLQDQSLHIAIPALVQSACQSAHITPECHVDFTESPPQDISLALFRIVQEALTNTVKHGRATKVSVHLWQKPERLHLQIVDNGRGFDPTQNTTGFGLRGMRERATTLGGTCQIWSALGEGCHVNVILPLPAMLSHPA